MKNLLLVSIFLLAGLSHGLIISPKLEMIKAEADTQMMRPLNDVSPPRHDKRPKPTGKPLHGVFLCEKGFKPVAFTATMPVDGTISRPELLPLVYKKVVTNIGKGYDSITGVFKAPISGVYYFSFHSFYWGGTGSSGGSLYHNEEQVVSWYGNDLLYSVSGSNSAVLELKCGDDVYVGLWKKSKISDNSNRYSSFSGYLLYHNDKEPKPTPDLILEPIEQKVPDQVFLPDRYSDQAKRPDQVLIAKI